jgi:uncharacterized membrane protein YqaE (UPF0057 family)
VAGHRSCHRRARPENFPIAKTSVVISLPRMDNKIVLIILAIFLPPLAVFLKTSNAKTTIINLILCFLFWIPGVIHALITVLK